jgi:hypothetical protein
MPRVDHYQDPVEDIGVERDLSNFGRMLLCGGECERIVEHRDRVGELDPMLDSIGP